MSVNVNLTTGVFPTTQRPLDAKRYFITLAELTDLGTNSHKAYYYYDRMKVLCLEDDNEYIWREESVPNEQGGLLTPGHTYPANTINNTIDYSNKTFNFFNANPRVATPLQFENFGASWTGSGLDYYCYASSYKILNSMFSTTPDTVTLDPVPATVGDKRKDAIVVNILGQFVIKKGIESPNPEDPDINDVFERLITIILLENGTATPVGQSTDLIYDENLGTSDEWDVSVENLVEGTINQASTSNPNTGSVHIECKGINPECVISFKDEAAHNVVDLSSILIDIETPLENVLFKVLFLLNGVEVSNAFNIYPGVVSYSGAGAGYQNLIIPKSAFTFTDTTYDTIVLSFRNFDTDGKIDTVNIDNIRLIDGGDIIITSAETWIGLNDTFENNYNGKAGYTPIVNPTETGLILTQISPNTLQEVLDAGMTASNDYGANGPIITNTRNYYAAWALKGVGIGFGLKGEASGGNSVGVEGRSTSSSGSGVQGLSTGTSGYGVYGQGNAVGAIGVSYNNIGIGVKGINWYSAFDNPDAIGVWAESTKGTVLKLYSHQGSNNIQEYILAEKRAPETGFNPDTIGMSFKYRLPYDAFDTYSQAKREVIGWNAGVKVSYVDTYLYDTNSPFKVMSLFGTGEILSPTVTNAKIDSEATGKVLTTKEWVLDKLNDDYLETTGLTGTHNIDWNIETHDLTLTGNLTLTESNVPGTNKTKVLTIYAIGDFTITFPANWETYKTGTYDGKVLNQIVIERLKSGKYWLTINKPD